MKEALEFLKSSAYNYRPPSPLVKPKDYFQIETGSPSNKRGIFFRKRLTQFSFVCTIILFIAAGIVVGLYIG
jgi:hypothetical protein